MALKRLSHYWHFVWGIHQFELLNRHLSMVWDAMASCDVILMALFFFWSYYACRVNSWDPFIHVSMTPLIARFMGPIWGPSGADRTQVGPMLAPWTLLSGTTKCEPTICIILAMYNKVVAAEVVRMRFPTEPIKLSSGPILLTWIHLNNSMDT